MGCGSSTSQAGACAGNNNKEAHNKLSPLIRRRVDNIRRRRNRVGDVITMEASLSFNVLIKDDRSSAHNSISNSSSIIQNNTILSDDEKEELHGVDATKIVNNDEMNNSDWGKNVVVDAVLRAIEDLLLAEEREYGAAVASQLLNDYDKSGVSKHRQMYVPDSPSFRVYCTRLNSFDSCSTKDNDLDHEALVKDVAKTKHGRCKSMDTASVMSNEEEEEGSRKGKMEGRQKGEITKKTVSNWKLASPLGMRNLFVMSCYSCSPHNRDRFLSRG